jgi:histidine triad (HIT) family protein
MKCVFCHIGALGSDVFMENEHAFAIRDRNPSHPVHVLVISRRHVESLADGPSAELLGSMLDLAATVAKYTAISETGYRVVINTGADAGQTVKHLHMHVMGGERL